MDFITLIIVRYISKNFPTLEISIFPIKDDVVIFGLLVVSLALIFQTAQSKHPIFTSIYKYVPPLFLCYFIPALLRWPLRIIDVEHSQIYYISSRVFLPASIILLCLNIQISALKKLGARTIIMFLAAGISIILGGPLALWTTMKLFPNILGNAGEEWWRGLATIAGSWIGGGANQTAMKEIFLVSDSMFASLIIVDIVIANVWMGVLLYGSKINARIDTWLKADKNYLPDLIRKTASIASIKQSLPDKRKMFILLGASLGGVALAQFFTASIIPWVQIHADLLTRLKLDALLTSFFWLIVFATGIGLAYSFTPFRKLEQSGASEWGSIFLYLLVASIGMQINLKDLIQQPGLLVIGGLWMCFHIAILLLVARLIKAPFFIAAISSQANVGGAASAPIVAAAFHPSLAPVGVIMAVAGYALGTYGGIICALLMRWVSGG
jgi:uncharacterized membrane protein